MRRIRAHGKKLWIPVSAISIVATVLGLASWRDDVDKWSEVLLRIPAVLDLGQQGSGFLLGAGVGSGVVLLVMRKKKKNLETKVKELEGSLYVLAAFSVFAIKRVAQAGKHPEWARKVLDRLPPDLLMGFSSIEEDEEDDEHSPEYKGARAMLSVIHGWVNQIDEKIRD